MKQGINRIGNDLNEKVIDLDNHLNDKVNKVIMPRIDTADSQLKDEVKNAKNDLDKKIDEEIDHAVKAFRNALETLAKGTDQ